MRLPGGILKYFQLIFLLYLTGLSFTCLSQPSFRFEHFTTEHGLSENFIYSIIQDNKGYLWIGTHDGLNRYDGYSFKKYRHNPADSNSLPNNTINSICEDGQGNIWVGTNDGLCRYNPDNDIYTRVQLLNKSKDILTLMQADRDGILVKTGSGISHINTTTLKETEVTVFFWGSKDTHFLHYAQLIQNKSGRIFIALTMTDGYWAFRYNNNTKMFDEDFHTPINLGNTFWIKSWYYPGQNGFNWLGINGWEFQKYKSSETVTAGMILNHKINSAFQNAVMEDADNNFWLCTNTGLYFYDKKYESPHIILHESNEPGSISSNTVNTIYQDKTGIIWIGTINGLNKINPRQARFSHLTVANGQSLSLADNFVLGLQVMDSGNIGIHYNFSDNYFSQFNINDNRIEHTAHKNYNFKKWITGLIVQNPERLTEELTGLAADSLRMYSYGLNPAGKIFIDNDNNMWYVTGGSIKNLATGKTWDMNFSIADAKMINEEIWLASQGDGAGCFDTKAKQLKKYTVSKNNSISSNDVTSIITEENGNVWLGTKGGGLNYFDRKKNEFIHYTEDDGLCNSSIYCMVKDNRGKIWIGTSNGLSCFNPAEKKFKNYFRTDGLINSEFNRQSACKLPDGTIFMGGMNGIDFFHPDSLHGNSNPPQVLITDFKIFNKNIETGKNLSLKHTENFITLEFAAMDFTNPAGNKFMYKLEGVDKDWILLENRNFATYTYLKPGSYRFLVKGANSDGVWNESPVEFNFVILPAWYQTWWFLTLVILAVAAAIYILFRYRLHQKLRLYAVRQRIHRDLHDDVGATLSSVKAYSELLKDNPDNPVVTELIQQNATEMIEKLEVIAWATNPQHDSFGSLLDKMKKFAYPLCHAKKIDLNISADGIKPEMNMPGETRQNILLIFKEAINNTVKYSSAGSCNVEIGFKNSEFILLIADNGTGITDKVKGSGNGIGNMKARVAETGGEIKISSNNGGGTKIEVVIPYPFRNTKYLG